MLPELLVRMIFTTQCSLWGAIDEAIYFQYIRFNANIVEFFYHSAKGTV